MKPSIFTNANLKQFFSLFLAVGFALTIAEKGWDILHTVPLFRNRQVFRRRLLEGSPTVRKIKQWIRDRPPTCDNDPDPNAPRTSSKWNGMIVDRVLAFIKASKYIRGQSKFDEARTSFRTLENELLDTPSQQMHSTLQWNYESLRRARITLDGTAGILFQYFWSTLRWDQCYIYVWIDSSPQWKGQELFAASFDLIIQDMKHFYKRRLFPQISISKSMFSKWGKTYALLWYVF